MALRVLARANILSVVLASCRACPKPNMGRDAVINERERVCVCASFLPMANLISCTVVRVCQPLHGRRVGRCLLGVNGGARGRGRAVDASDR
jgi:hypothetical protein